MVLYAFYQKYPDISISLTIYNLSHDTTQRIFYLRNLVSDAEAEQIAQARGVMNEVAAEIHYLTGFGIDRGMVTLGGTQADEAIYSNLEPHPHSGSFFSEGALFSFYPTYYYAWTNGKDKGHRLLTQLLDDSWQIEVISHHHKVSFRLPCRVIPEGRRREYKPEDIAFFGLPYQTGRKRKKSGYALMYDRADPTFARFIDRFRPSGQLSFGENRYFLHEGGSVNVVGSRWPKSKAKPKKYPRKSVLASQPTDSTDYIYLIQAGRTKAYKIGKSNDPQSRLAGLQTASPHKLKLLHIFRADNATAAEESLHAALWDSRLAGEWFKLSDMQRSALQSVLEYKDGAFILGKEAVNVKILLGLT
jgi:hypothetical protein